MVPTSPQTQWVQNWDELLAVRGGIHFNHDQTEIVLTLPAPYKFGIRFMDAPNVLPVPPSIVLALEAARDKIVTDMMAEGCGKWGFSFERTKQLVDENPLVIQLREACRVARLEVDTQKTITVQREDTATIKQG